MKKIINVSKVLLIAVFVLFGSHFAFAAQSCQKSDKDSGTCSKWSCMDGEGCVNHNASGKSGQYCLGVNTDGSITITGAVDNMGTGDASAGECKGTEASLSRVYNITQYINDSIPSPVPAIPGTSPASNSQWVNTQQYVFKAYPFNQQQGGPVQNTVATPMPVNDPLVVGTLNPSGGISNGTSTDNPVDIDSNGKVPELFSFTSTSGGALAWPPTSIFNNMSLWLVPLADTFKTFSATTWAGTYNGVNSPNTIPPFAPSAKWYPLNYLTMDNPSQMVPLTPVTIKWNAVPGATSYHVHVAVANNPLTGMDSNLPNDELDVPSLNALTYTFTGRGLVTYSYYAQPLDASGNPMIGPVITTKGGTGYTDNPFWISTPQNNDNYCKYVTGRLYFSENNGLPYQDCNPVNETDVGMPSGTYQQIQAALATGMYNYQYIQAHTTYPYVYKNEPTGGYRRGYEFIEWNKDLFPYNISSYAIQYAFRPIPDGTPFTNGATFSYSYHPNGTGNLVTTTVPTHVISGISATDSNDLSNSLDPAGNRPGFQYDFGLSAMEASNPNLTPATFLATLANPNTIGSSGVINTLGVNPDGTPSGIYWRVAAFDSYGNMIHTDLATRGYVTPPVPKVPFASGFPVWPRANNTVATTGVATGHPSGYVVDVVTDPANFSKLPVLTGTGLPTVGTAIDGGSTETTSVDNSGFFLRRVVADGTYNAGTIAVNKFKDILKDTRKSFVDINSSTGYYDELEADVPWATSGITTAQSWMDYDMQTLTAYINSGDNDPNNYNAMYPPVTDGASLGLTVIPSAAANQLKFTTSVGVVVKSTGTAAITVVQSSDKKTTTLTFSASSGYYSFSIRELSTFPGDYPIVAHPLFYDVGSVPALGSLSSKITTEFDKLLPGTTYYWRQRCFNDPNPEAPNSGTTKLKFCPNWSATNSFTTPTNVPANITISPAAVTTVDKTTFSKSGLSKADVANLVNTNTVTTLSKTMAKGTLKRIDLAKVKPAGNTSSSKLRISPDQLKQFIMKQQSLQKAYQSLMNAKLPKNNDIQSAQKNFTSSIRSTLSVNTKIFNS